MYSRCRIGHKLLKPLRRSGHSDNKRHNRETIFLLPLINFCMIDCALFSACGDVNVFMRFIDYNKKDWADAPQHLQLLPQIVSSSKLISAERLSEPSLGYSENRCRRG